MTMLPTQVRKPGRKAVIRRAFVALAVLCPLLTGKMPVPLLCGGEPTPPPPAPTVIPGIDKPPPKKKEETLPEVDWSAAKQTFVEDKGLVILSGSAWVRYQGTKLEADHIVFYRQSREVYAEGSVRLRVGESEIDAEKAYMDIENETGYLVDAVVRVSSKPDATQGTGLAAIGGSKKEKAERRLEKREEVRQLAPVQTATSFIRTRDPYGIYLEPVNDPQARTNLLLSAGRLVKKGRLLYSADDAFITSDDMAHPMYGIKAGKVDFYLHEGPDPRNPEAKGLRPGKIVAKGARLTILGFSLFPFPTITYDLIKGYPFFQNTGGRSTRWGPYSLNRFGYNLGAGAEEGIFELTRVYLDLDERYKRGPAAGFELDWESGWRPSEAKGEKAQFERGEGHVRVYATDEIQTSRKDDLWRARRDLERRIQPKMDGFPRRDFDANLLFAKRRRLDDAGPPSFDLDQHRDEWRGMADFQQHQPLKRFAGLDNLVLDLVYSQQTDRDFMLEYFQNDYMKNNQPEALASLRKPGDNYSIELLYRANPQDFDGAPPRSPTDYGMFTGYEPALTYSLAPTPARYGVYMASVLQAARMTRSFERDIYDQPGFETGRAYATVDFSRPTKWGPVNIVPHLGTQQAVYDDSRDGNGTAQGAVTYGLDVTSRIYGTLPDLENPDLGLQGFRHIIEPRISYRGVSDTYEKPETILDFDEIDDLTALDKVTFAVDQTFQTRRTNKEGETRSVNVAGFDMALDYFPRNRDQKRLLNGDTFDLLRLDGFIRVVDILKVDGSLGLNPQNFQTERASYGITIDPQTRWRLKLEERFNYRDRDRAIAGSDQYRAKVEYQMSERWGVAFERVWEQRRSLLQRKGRQVDRLTVTRSYGALDVAFTYALDRNFGENAFFASVRPAIVYRNVVVPSQDLLVSAGEVSGEETEAPEERNFDPFDLLKKGRKKGGAGPSGKGGAGKAPGRDEDVPVPPPPTPDKRADKGGQKAAGADLFRDPNAPASADLFRDPKEAAPRKRPAKVDDDEWTAPPATPASTR